MQTCGELAMYEDPPVWMFWGVSKHVIDSFMDGQRPLICSSDFWLWERNMHERRQVNVPAGAACAIVLYQTNNSRAVWFLIRVPPRPGKRLTNFPVVENI